MLAKFKFIGLSVALWCAAFVTGVACGDGDGDDGGSCDEAKQGFTSCKIGLGQCQPGQYCDDFDQCQNGCLSDVNCACNQVCNKPAGVNEGTCQAKAEPEPGTETGAETGTPMTGNPTESGDPKAVCKELCSATDFFSCFMPGELQACFDSCDAATDAQVEQYFNCASMTVECPALIACLDNLP